MDYYCELCKFNCNFLSNCLKCFYFVKEEKQEKKEEILEKKKKILEFYDKRHYAIKNCVKTREGNKNSFYFVLELKINFLKKSLV